MTTIASSILVENKLSSSLNDGRVHLLYNSYRLSRSRRMVRWCFPLGKHCNSLSSLLFHILKANTPLTLQRGDRWYVPQFNIDPTLDVSFWCHQNSPKVLAMEAISRFFVRKRASVLYSTSFYFTFLEDKRNVVFPRASRWYSGY